MKKFKFSLSKLLELKEQQYKMEKETLAVLRGKKQVLDERLISLRQSFAGCNEEYTQCSMSGITVQEISVYKNFLAKLKQQIEDIIAEIDLAEIRIQNQLSVVVVISQDISTIEKLKEKQLNQYNYQLNKSEEILIEEFVNSVRLNGD